MCVCVFAFLLSWIPPSCEAFALLARRVSLEALGLFVLCELQKELLEQGVVPAAVTHARKCRCGSWSNEWPQLSRSTRSSPPSSSLLLRSLPAFLAGGKGLSVDDEDHPHSHYGIESFTFRSRRPFHPERLMGFVMEHLPSVLRSKVGTRNNAGAKLGGRSWNQFFVVNECAMA